VKTFFKSLDEAVVNRLFFLPSGFTAAENKCFFASIRGRTEFYFETFMDFFPVLREKMLLEFLQLAFARTNDVASAFLFEQFQVVGAGHTAVHDPDTIGFAVEGFHLLDHGFNGF